MIKLRDKDRTELTPEMIERLTDACYDPEKKVIYICFGEEELGLYYDQSSKAESDYNLIIDYYD